MYHELLERVALLLAKTEGWEIEDIHGDNPRVSNPGLKTWGFSE